MKVRENNMEKILPLKVYICTAVGAAGAFLTRLFGGWSEDMVTLIILMVIDYITGVSAAAFFKKSDKSSDGSLSSAAGLKGLLKKGAALLVVLVAHRLDISLGVQYIKSAAVIGFIINEVISVTENAGLMGVPLPEVIRQSIEVLKDKSNRGGRI